MSRNLRGLSRRRGLNNGLYESIADAAAGNDRERDAGLVSVAREFMTGDAAVLGASSFYDFMQPGHHDKKAFMCDGTACLTSGRREEVRQALLGKFQPHEIGTMTCLGHCHSNNGFLAGGEIRLCTSGDRRETFNVSSNAEMPALIPG